MMKYNAIRRVTVGAGRQIAIAAALAFFSVVGAWPQAPAANQTPPPLPPTPALLQRPPVPLPAAHLALDRAIELALQHNHTLLAERTTVDQSRAEETTANLRPNPVLGADAQFLPIFSPGSLNGTYIDQSAQFDIGLSYLIERGKKRQHRLQAARDQTAVTAATVADNERTLTANVAQQFINALLAKANLELAQMDLDSFQQAVQIGDAQYQAGSMSEGDLLKLKLQLLQFQMDFSAARLAKVQALADLREFVGFDAIPENYDVDGDLTYEPIKSSEDDLKMMALLSRPDYHASQLSVTLSQSQLGLAKADGKRDVTVTGNYDHLAGLNDVSAFGSIQLPIFDRNQGEIARAGFAVTQAQEMQSAASEGVISDVINAYENLRTNDELVSLYTGGYLKEAQDSRDIAQYAYQRGGASLLDFLDAERSYRSTELGYRQAVASYMLAVEQLRQAVGNRSIP